MLAPASAPERFLGTSLTSWTSITHIKHEIAIAYVQPGRNTIFFVLFSFFMSTVLLKVENTSQSYTERHLCQFNSINSLWNLIFQSEVTVRVLFMCLCPHPEHVHLYYHSSPSTLGLLQSAVLRDSSHSHMECQN